jgi:hypothetical protein
VSPKVKAKKKNKEEEEIVKDKEYEDRDEIIETIAYTRNVVIPLDIYILKILFVHK